MSMKLWDVASGKEIRTFKGHSSWLSSVAFSPDGRHVLSASGDQTIKLWDIATGNVVKTFIGDSHSVTFSPNGRYFLAGDNILKLWDITSGKVVRTFKGNSTDVKSVAFSPDGRYALSGSQQGMYGSGNEIKLWDVATGKEIRMFDGNDDVNFVAFSPDGRYALSGSSDRTVYLWNVASGKKVRTFTGRATGENVRDVSSVAFSPDGHYALAGRSDNVLDLWEIKTGKEIKTFGGKEPKIMKGYSPSVFSVAFSPDGRYALSGSSDRTMKLWDIATGKEIRTFKGNDSNEETISPDSRYFISGRDNKALILLEISTGKQIRTFTGSAASISFVAFSPDGRFILTGNKSDKNTLTLWEVATGKQIRTLKGIDPVAFSPDGRHALSNSDDGLKLWEVATGKQIRTLKGGYPVVFSPDSRYVLTGDRGDKNTLTLWDVATGKQIKTFRERTSKSLLKIIEDVAFSPDGRYFLVARFDNILTLREVATGKQIRTFKGHSGWISSVAFSPDGRYALSGSGDHTMKLWEVSTGKEIVTFRGHTGHVNGVAFSPDGKYAFSKSDDKTLRIWKTATGKELGQFVSFADGEWVAITSDGYFNASVNEAKNINVRIDNKVYPIDNFYKKYFNPGYVASVLQGKTTASFDCNKSLSKAEKMICNNPELTDLDVKLNVEYKDVLDMSDLIPRQNIISEQKLWQENTRDVCNDEQCLKQTYLARIEAINALLNKHNSPRSPEPDFIADLCKENEEVFFLCQAKSKTISLCASADASATKGYLVYRYGRNGQPVELEYPSPHTPPAKVFKFVSESGSKGGAEELSFSTGGHVYTLYGDHWGGLDPEQYFGVFVEKDGHRIANIRCNDKDEMLDDMYFIGVDETPPPHSHHFIGLPSSGEIRTDMFE